MPRNRELSRAINRISWGIVNTISGLLLYQLAFGIALLTTSGGKNAATAGKVAFQADNISDRLFATLNPEQLKSALQNLKRKGLIETIKGKRYELKITRLGLERLEKDLPAYREERWWDKRIYLVNYDIEESEKDLRKQLRSYLLSIGCAQLQKSTYLAVYNPRGLLRTWVSGHLRTGEILVSDLGPDGSLGDKPLPDLVSEAFWLPRLNSDYAKFLHDYSLSSKADPLLKTQAAFCFNGILERDPQLPFELLPDWWLGDEAYDRYKSIVGNSFLSSPKSI